MRSEQCSFARSLVSGLNNLDPTLTHVCELQFQPLCVSLLQAADCDWGIKWWGSGRHGSIPRMATGKPPPPPAHPHPLNSAGGVEQVQGCMHLFQWAWHWQMTSASPITLTLSLHIQTKNHLKIAANTVETRYKEIWSNKIPDITN